MADLRRVPPGRAGRRWLSQRLATARHAADLLDRKLRLLRLERARYERLAGRRAQEWASACRAADAWLLRAALAGGQRDLVVPDVPAARVDVVWDRLMGVAYPAETTCHLPEDPFAGWVPGSAALVEAAAAYRTAVHAGAAAAAASGACRALDEEIARTGRRRRAITAMRIPHLESALRDLTAALEESERAELIRLRWAGEGTGSGRR